jgi:hypothetical protein
LAYGNVFLVHCNGSHHPPPQVGDICEMWGWTWWLFAFAFAPYIKNAPIHEALALYFFFCNKKKSIEIIIIIIRNICG